MSMPRLRLPSPAIVISMIALVLAIGGTAVAASTAKHADKKADIKLITALAPTLSVKHATNADQLGGLAASGYVANSGSIFISAGSSNWNSLDSHDPIEWLYTLNATWATSSGAGTYYLTAHPSIPTALYGKNLEATAATLCYSASASATIIEVKVVDSRYSNNGVGAVNTLVDDHTNRTDGACRTYSFSTPVTLTSLDDVGLLVGVTYSGASHVLIGQSGITLTPTTQAASSHETAIGGSVPAARQGATTRR